MSQIPTSVITWYKAHGRDLPWRQTADPYHIWLSEVILQQTRVAQGLAYYNKFKEIFPKIENLANASEDQVLEQWQGLGYYSRARNLHLAAKHVWNELKGQFPQNYDGLLKLKGIGDYTASAIASFAYHEDKAVVDGNVIRVVARLFGITSDVRQGKTVQQVKKIVDELLPKGNSYLFNQGMMELGALVCVPKNPKCSQCPVSENCFARRDGQTEEIPFKSKLKEKRIRFLNYLLLKVGDELFMTKRGPGDIWEGLYEPILFEDERAYEDVGDFVQNKTFNLPEKYEYIRFIPAQKHILTHQELWVSICLISLKEKPKGLSGIWIKENETASTPKSIIISKLLSELNSLQLHLNFN